MIGIDIGRQRDPSAIAVAEGMALRHLERLPLGTPYPEVVERIAELVRLLPEHGLTIDATGVGRAVVDMLGARGIQALAVTITGGRSIVVAGSEVSLPRAALFLPLIAGIEAGTIRIARQLTDAPALLAEIKDARRQRQRIEARGSGHHGDLMTAAALAFWAQGIDRVSGPPRR